MVGINLDGFSLANRLRFAKFAKLSPRQTFPLYGIRYSKTKGYCKSGIASIHVTKHLLDFCLKDF